ncbi:MAG: methionine--tRNA ligase [Gemmatimonadota bacterium]|nr:methionine--tRNA ligase [Gemmatimonadota bacterium]
MPNKYYITTAIDYANGDPHLGHAFEKIGADVLARYHRQRGDEVLFVTGMDEHGQKVAQSAAKAGRTPQEQVDEIASRFQDAWKTLGISYDRFVRTTDESHKNGVRALIERIFERAPDSFYVKAYAGRYCVGCEAFKTDEEIVDEKCVLHPTRTLEWVEERNWFFRLSAYADRLKSLLASGRLLEPRTRANEILSLIEQGLEDVSASRARAGWGIPFPRDTGDGEPQTTYVWFDALPNYITAVGFPDTANEFEKWWPADIHVIGKDITRFHALIWPAMLIAAELPLPRLVWAHGFVLLAGDRFSKSAGVTLDLHEAVGRYGADAFRYFLMREVPFDADGNFSWERFEDRYNSDLANAFGNLASRTIAMIEKYCESSVPHAPPATLDDADAVDVAAYHAAMLENLPNRALEHIWASVARGNEYVDRQAPWKLARDPASRARLDTTLAALARQLVRHAIALAPFMPGRSTELLAQLGAPTDFLTTPGLLGATGTMNFDPTGWRVKKGASLFPKKETVHG